MERNRKLEYRLRYLTDEETAPADSRGTYLVLESKWTDERKEEWALCSMYPVKELFTNEPLISTSILYKLQQLQRLGHKVKIDLKK